MAGGIVYHVLNRANGGATLFEGDGDYFAFERIMREAHERVPMRTLAYCIMPTHWHLVLWPWADGDISGFIGWLTLTHAKRWHAHHETQGSGHLYQDRYKSFVVDTDGHFLTVCRYVERNALRAKFVTRAEDWRWCDLWHRARRNAHHEVPLADWPVDPPPNWLQLVNEPQTHRELAGLRACIVRGRPYGTEEWVERTAHRLGLAHTLRPRGRPRKRTPP